MDENQATKRALDSSSSQEDNETKSKQLKVENEATAEKEQDFLGFENFSNFYQVLTTGVKATVASCAQVPIKENELDYYLAFESFNSFMTSQNQRILKLMGNILKQQNIKKHICSNKLDDDERMDLLVDVNDQIIEKLGIQLDEIQGLRKKTETEIKLSGSSLNTTSRNISTSWNKEMGMIANKSPLMQNSKSSPQSSAQKASPMSASLVINKKGFIPKPQETFVDKVNNSNLPFVPKIRHKPNALTPLHDIFQKLDDANLVIDEEFFKNNLMLYENPYTYEIEQCKAPDVENSAMVEIQKPNDLDSTKYKYIDTLDDLVWLCDYLGKDNRARIKEIAVDLEHHSYRSFLGFTCLMQISTRQEDFIIDTIKLRAEMHRLNDIFTDWTLLKVLHGADFDVEWLQKDFGIYVVNMFDTGQAARVLQYPHYSLSYLLQKFCQISAQKHFQLADWRQRPLDEAMIRYAREDTHYLLFIYDNLVKELLNSTPSLESINNHALVYEKSKVICKKVYKKPIFYSKGFLNLCQSNAHLNSKQLKALQDLYKWRDNIARECDESCEYVLKNHQLLKIAELLPREIYGILALCNPISPIVESNVHEIHALVKSAREWRGTLSIFDIKEENEKNLSNLSLLNSADGANKMSENLLDSIVHSIKYDPDSVLNCPHDYPHNQERESEHMDVEKHTNQMEVESNSNLRDLFLKTSHTSLTLPPNLNCQHNSTMSKMFYKTNQPVKASETSRQSIIAKVKFIKESIRNPFEMYLPAEFRVSRSDVSGDDELKWILLKPRFEHIVPKSAVKNESTDAAEAATEINEDPLMIPIKKQIKQEKNKDKKFKKIMKNVNFTEAIIEYNRKQTEQANARLGDNTAGEDGQQSTIIENFNNIENKILEGLKKVKDSVKNIQHQNASTTAAAEAAVPFSYNEKNMNSIFKKPEKDRNVFDPTSKIKQNKYENKLNKRRNMNPLTRDKNHKNVSFKTDK